MELELSGALWFNCLIVRTLPCICLGAFTMYLYAKSSVFCLSCICISLSNEFVYI